MTTAATIALVHAPYLLDGANPANRKAVDLAAAEDRAVLGALAAHDVQTRRVAWSDPAVDWAGFDLIVLRGVWDYIDHLAAFDAWLRRADVAPRVLNPAALVHWNIDKRYLLALADAGLAVVPTRHAAIGEAIDIEGLCRVFGTSELVIKPAISAGGMHTYRVRAGDAEMARKIGAVGAMHALLVQPFLPEILGAGEVSLIVIGGSVTHAVRKRAGGAEFRVQSSHGGTVESYGPTPAELAFAQAVVAHCPQPPLYARVDFVQCADGPLLMELELIEPDLFLRTDPAGPAALATALLQALPHRIAAI